jgi:hypothetical protein
MGGSCAGVEDVLKLMKDKEAAYERVKDVEITAEDLLIYGVIDKLPAELAAIGDIMLTKEKPKYRELRNFLKDKLSGAGNDDKATALKTFASSPPCAWCGIKGHYAAQCRKKQAWEDKHGSGGTSNNKKQQNNSNDKGNKGKKGEQRCYDCGSTEHKFYQCPKNAHKRKKKGKATARLAAASLSSSDESE